MDKFKAHDVVHQFYGGMSENCPGCSGKMADGEMMAEAKKIAVNNYKPKVGSDVPYEKRLMSYAELDAKSRNSLGDSDFAYIDENGGRHLPIHDAAHVRNALARFNQTNFENDAKKQAAKKKIDAKAKELGVNAADNNDDDGKKMEEFALNPIVDILSFGEKENIPTRIKVIPVGEYNMGRYGKVNITLDKVKDMVKHFNENVRAHTNKIGLPIDVEHGTTQWKDAAAGWLKKLYAEEDGGYADVDWTSLGKKLLKEKIYKLYSPEFYFEYKDPQYGFQLKNVMTGGGLVNKPMIKDDLLPIVNAEGLEDNQNNNLTKNKSAVTLFMETPNVSEKNHMTLSEIVTKEKTQRTSEEQKFLIDNQDQLTFAEAKKEGLVPEKVTATETPEAGKISMSEDEVKKLKEQAALGAGAAEKLRRVELKEEVKKLVFTDKGSKLKTDQIEKTVDLLMTMSEDQAKVYKEQLGELPTPANLFSEVGNDKDETINEGNAMIKLDEKTKAYAKENKLSYADAQKIVCKENPDLVGLAYPTASE